jgi:hypothetical protein
MAIFEPIAASEIFKRQYYFLSEVQITQLSAVADGDAVTERKTPLRFSGELYTRTSIVLSCQFEKTYARHF